MRAYLLDFDCLCSVEKLVIIFNARAFLIPICKRLIDDTQEYAHIFKDILEPTV